MLSSKIIITGATGFIGRHLTYALIDTGFKVIVFSRNPSYSSKLIPAAYQHVKWDSLKPEEWQDYLEDSLGVINLAAAPLTGKKWTDEYKKEIVFSRVISTANIANAILNTKNPPDFFISVSAVGYYGNTISEVDEDSGKGKGFLSDVCKQWEDAAMLAKPKTRVVTPRLGIVLDSTEGALAKMLTPYKFFIGGPLGNGKQWVSWIHILDALNLLLLCVEKDTIEGPINLVSPNPVDMNDFARAIGRAMKKPVFMRMPETLIKFWFGEAASVLLDGQKVIPKKALDSGYKFEFSYPYTAILDVIKHKSI